MALQGFFSQLLGSGASKSMADYNTQQQLNELLRDGWVRLGEGSDPKAPFFEEGEVDEEEASTSRTSLMSDDQMSIMRGIAQDINDPELLKLINEMFSPTETAISPAPETTAVSPAPETTGATGFRKATADEGDFFKDFDIADQYIQEIKRDPTNRYPTVGGKTIQEQPNAEEIQRQVTTYTDTLDYDRSVTDFQRQQVIDKPPIAPDGKRWIWSIDQDSRKLVDAMPVSDPSKVNPDPKSRGFVNKAFGKVREQIDGFVPSGEEAGHFLKPIAEQLNAMFGKSDPLDMDGYEMGPYHAQRIAAREQQDQEERTRLEKQRGIDQDKRWREMSYIEKQNVQVNLLGKLLSFQAKRGDEIARLKALLAIVGPDADLALDPGQYGEIQGEISKIVEELGNILDNTLTTDYMVGFHALNPGIGSDEWWPRYNNSMNYIRRGIHRMLGLTEAGESLLDIDTSTLTRPEWDEKVEEATSGVVTPKQQEDIVTLMLNLDALQGRLDLSAQIKFQAMIGSGTGYSEYLQKRQQGDFADSVHSLITSIIKSNDARKGGKIDTDALWRKAHGRGSEEDQPSSQTGSKSSSGRLVPAGEALGNISDWFQEKLPKNYWEESVPDSSTTGGGTAIPDSSKAVGGFSVPGQYGHLDRPTGTGTKG